MTIKQEYLQFLKENFKGLKIRKPLFYNWKYGLRFNLQTGKIFKSTRQILDADGNVIPLIGDTTTNEYFIEVTKRASILIKSVFEPYDQIFFVFLEYKFRKRKIRFSNYAFK